MGVGRGRSGASWAPRAALAAASALLALLAAEVGSRVAGARPGDDPRTRFHPVLGWTADPEWRRVGGVNEDGFRHNVVPENPAGRRRLVILGDSFSFAGLYPVAQTYAGHLEKWLSRERGDEAWDVVNLASGGYGTAQQLLALREIGLGFDPDVVVLQMFPFNDLCNNNRGQAFTCSFQDLHRPYFVPDGNGLRVTRLYPWRTRLRRLSRLYALLETRFLWGLPAAWRGAPEGVKRRAGLQVEEAQRVGLAFASNRYSLVPEPHQPPVIRAAWEVTERLVDEIAALLRERDVPLVGVVLPYADTFLPDWEALSPRGLPRLDPGYGTASAERMLEAAGARVVSGRRRMLAGEAPPRSHFFPEGRDDKHLNDLGHYAVATWIFAELQGLGLTEHRPPPAWTDLCAPRLRRLALQALEATGGSARGPGTRSRQGVVRRIRAVADDVAECRFESAEERLDALVRSLEPSDDPGVGANAAEREAILAGLRGTEAAIAAGRCGDC